MRIYTTLLLVVAMMNNGASADEHSRISRVRKTQEAPHASQWWRAFNVGALFKERNQVLAFEDGADEVDGFFQVMAVDHSMPSASPTVSAMPSSAPSVSAMPSAAPSVSAMPSAAPSVSVMPSETPTIAGPGATPNPSAFPTFEPSAFPTDEPSAGPSPFPTFEPSVGATPFPTKSPTVSPTESPSEFPSEERSRFPTFFPTVGASVEISESPSISSAPSQFPTLFVCQITPEQRIIGILAVLDQVADATLIRDISTPQGQATDWLLNEDEEQICPDDPKIIQRWALAVMYFSTEGDGWDQCFAGDPFCGILSFIGSNAFLDEVDECGWAGITCDLQTGCVTQIEFENNGLAGTIPTELALLTDLEFLGMEEGTTSGTIPSELGTLSNMFFIDLDFNQLTGTIPSELFGLSLLRTLDLNDNLLTGRLEPGLGNLVNMVFFQVHFNNLTGAIPSEIGNMQFLDVFTLYGNDIQGEMPEEICDLRGFDLSFLVADCRGGNPDVQCSPDCCTGCRAG